MGKHLVIAGGGHAHMLTLANLHKFIEKGHKVTVIGPSPHHYYSGMGPGMLGKTYKPEEIRFATKHTEIFGGGDCVYLKDLPLDKFGVYAVRENPVLYHNLMASLDGTGLHTFEPGGEYLLIFNMGDGTGVLRKKRVVLGGRLAFIIKNYIDRKFMRKFKSIE